MKPSLKFAIAFTLLILAAPMLVAQSKDKDKDKDSAPAPAPSRHLMSWTADRREYRVGDVITILVSDATLATATKSQNGSDAQTRKNGLGITPPKIGTTALPAIDASLDLSKNSSSSQTGDAKRNLTFKGDISVRVVAIDKSGQLQVKGAKLVDVDKNKQTLNLTGWIRPEDITPDNLVQSERVADVQLTYVLTGDIGKTRGGLIGRLLNTFWP